jgi:hypothetical protein
MHHVPRSFFSSTIWRICDHLPVGLIGAASLLSRQSAVADDASARLPDGAWKLEFQDEFSGVNSDLDKTWGF